jgi:hypothetical protein
MPPILSINLKFDKEIEKLKENGPPYPEVTWVNLPSSLMIDYSNAFVFSTYLLVLVFRDGLTT